MPGRFIRTSSGLLGGVLIVAGLGYAAIGFGWLGTPTQQRLAGVEWLGIAGSDTTIGAGWVAVGVTVTLCGAFSKRRVIETTGTLLSIFWPVLIGLFFLTAWWTGESRTGWITTVSYTAFAAVIATVASQPRPPAQRRLPCPTCGSEER